METFAGWKRGEAVVAEINVTPMIDVMLVLLIIFMVVTSSVAERLPAVRSALPEAEDRVTVSVDAGGALRVEPAREAVAGSALAARLREAFARRRDDQVLYLRADERAPYARVLDVVEAAREAGVRKVGMIARPVADARR